MFIFAKTHTTSGPMAIIINSSLNVINWIAESPALKLVAAG